MDSQLADGILPLIAVDRSAARPLHRQLYDAYCAAIIRGDLRPGQRVPSSRALAVDLRISRIPVLNAYAQLLAEGYLESRVGAGTFVSSSLPDQRIPYESSTAGSIPAGSAPRPVARRVLLLPREEVFPWRGHWGAFGPHQPALDQFPLEVWSRLVLRHCRSPRVSALYQTDPLGSEEFRDAICAYLRTARGVRCDPHQIMIIAGSQQGFEITARVLLDAGSPVWVEEPGYLLAQRVLQLAGCRLIPVPVDSEGLDVAAGVKLCRKARAVYVVPSHQYPLGATMSASRRFQLLEWAQTSGSWIIEDDYDSEYRYESMPIPSLQGLDSQSRVIYVGTFSKVLFPSLRIGYMVIPPDLVNHFVRVRRSMDLATPNLYQAVLTDFIKEGHFARHLRRMRLVYAERRAALVDSIRKEFGSILEVHGAEAGMHLAVTLPKGFRDREIAARAAREKLWLWPLSPYYLGDAVRQGFVLGFGSTSAAEMPLAVSQMKSVLSAD
jgi:GntR family transcriptional regulator / MocR family aminotransferase